MTGRVAIHLSSLGTPRWRRVDADGLETGSGILVGNAGFVEEDDEVIAIVPGGAVTIHWLELAAASSAQASAAARHLAAEVVAGPADAQHFAAATSVDASGRRAVAVVARETVQGWLDRLAAHGIDPAALVPAPMLLPVAGDAVTTQRSGDQLLARAEGLAIEAEAPLVELVIGNRRSEPVLRDLLDLCPPLAEVPINLRQGEFRSAYRGKGGRPYRRLAILAAASALAWIGGDVAGALRSTLRADAMTDEMTATAARLMPAVSITDPAAQLAERAATLGATTGFSGMASALFAALEASGSLRLEALRYTADGGIRATVAVPRGASVAPLAARLEASGLAMVTGAARPAASGELVEIEVKRR